MVFKISQIGLVFVLLSVGVLEARTQHYSSNSDQPEMFLTAIENYRKSPRTVCEMSGGEVRAGIVTHHFLANRLMVDFFECLASKAKPERIILIGPDHFNKGMRSVTVSPLPWKTPFGELVADEIAVSRIKNSLDLIDDPEAFSGEHSIGILVPFIRYYFPKSKIVPIIVQKQMSLSTLKKFKQLIDQSLDDPGTLVLLSMDFTHNQTSEEADRRDERTRKAIENLDYKNTDSLDVDCHPGLFLLTAALKDRKNLEIKFLNHTNSSRITGNRDQKDVTSYFTILFTQKSLFENNSTK
jgi:AmmeMemoRadiSam system protein B